MSDLSLSGKATADEPKPNGSGSSGGLILPDSMKQEEAAANQPDEIRLSTEVKLGANVLELFCEASDVGGLPSSDIFIPCLNTDGLAPVSPLAVMPIGMPPPRSPKNLEEVIVNLINELEPQLAQQNIKPQLYLLHLNTSKDGNNLLVATLPSKLIGGVRRHEWYRINAAEGIAEGPLEEGEIAEHTFFGEVIQSLREAAFHLRQTGDATRARELLATVLEAEPDRTEAMMMLAQLYIAIGNQITASGYIADVLRVDPDHSAALLLHTRFLLDAGDIAQAEEILSALAERLSGDPEIPLLRARIALAKHEWAQAKEFVYNALELDSENQEALMLKKVMEEGPDAVFGELLGELDDEDLD